MMALAVIMDGRDPKGRPKTLYMGWISADVKEISLHNSLVYNHVFWKKAISVTNPK